MSLVPISIPRLRSEYTSLTAANTLAGAGILFSFERFAWDCLDTVDDNRKPVAFALAATFDLLARRQDGEPIAFDEGRMYFDIFDQPIRSSIDFLAGNDPLANPLKLVAGLADAYKRLRREI